MNNCIFQYFACVFYKKYVYLQKNMSYGRNRFLCDA